MSSKSVQPGQVHESLKSIIAGLPTLPSGLTSLSVLGVTYDIASIGTKLGGYESTYAAANTAALAAKTALDARDLVAPQVQAFVSATKASLKAALGKSAPALEGLGITPDKAPTPLTVEQKKEKIAKAKATRLARHTMGPKAKAKIKGVPGGTGGTGGAGGTGGTTA